MSRKAWLTIVLLLTLLLGACAESPEQKTPTPSEPSSPQSPKEELPEKTLTVPPPTQATPEVKKKQSPQKEKAKKTISLTFDDGPSEYTLEILKILNEEDVPATFFVIGQQVEGNESTIRALAKSGMEVESHSWDHSNLAYLSKSSLIQNNKKTEKAIQKITGKEVSCIRPPYGSVNSAVRSTMKQEKNRIIMWDIDPQDWARPGSKSIVKNVKTYHKDKGVILMHDGGGQREQTVEALPDIIKFLKKEGYEFVPACQG